MPCTNNPACTCANNNLRAQDLPPPYTWRADGGYLTSSSSESPSDESSSASSPTTGMPTPTKTSVQPPPSKTTTIYHWCPAPPLPAKKEPAPPAVPPTPALTPAPDSAKASTKRQKVCFTRRTSDGGTKRICVSFPVAQASKAESEPAPTPEPAPASINPPSTKAACTKAASVKPASAKPPSTKVASCKPASNKAPSSKKSAPKSTPEPAAEPAKDPTPPPPNPLAPPSLPPGTNYMFPTTHTMLHIFSRASPIWESRYHNQPIDFKIFKVPTVLTVKDIIARVRGSRGGECEGWGVVEVVEKGDGEWIKGSTVAFGSAKAKCSLGILGWGPKRGAELPPVWIVVCKVG